VHARDCSIAGGPRIPASESLPQGEIDSKGRVNGGIRFDVYSPVQDVYALLIGAASSASPSWTDNNPGSWVGNILGIYTNPDYSLSAGTAPEAIIFTNVPDSFKGYSLAYLFYASDAHDPLEPIGPSTNGILYAHAVSGASPFVYLTDPFNPNTQYNLDGFSSNSTVPLPPTVYLLGSGLLGLAGWRRFRKS
jgi:hypothetical protein